MLIIDVNNWVRVKMAESISGVSVATLWSELISNSLKGKEQLYIADGVNGNERRRKYFPEYKRNRKPVDQSIYDGINFFKELLADAPQNVGYLEVPGYEADDVIANIAYLYSLKGDEVQLISTDKDLTQLSQLNNVTTLGEPKTDPKWVKLYKTMVGDSSDNIPGIKGFGQKSWDKLSDDFKNRMTVMFHLYDCPEKMPKDYIRKLCLANMSDSLTNAFMVHLENGDLHKYNKIIGFCSVPSEELSKIKYGSGNIQAATDKLSYFSL